MTGTSVPAAGFAEVNDARLYYEVAGSGHPLVLIHAGIADSRMWDDQLVAFTQRYRAIRYDLRGFGQSYLPPGPFRMDDDLFHLLTLLGVERAYLLGCSIGGGIALHFALEHPEMVAGLVLVGSGLSGYPEQSDDLRRYDQGEEAALEAGDVERVIDLNLRMWVDGPRRSPDQIAPAVRERARALIAHNSTRSWEHTAPQRPDPPAIGRLGEISAPTLVLVGDQDVSDLLAVADLLAVGIPGARKVIMPGVAHLPNLERPEQFNRLVLDFLQS